MAEPWLEHPRAFVETAAGILDGMQVERAQLTGFLSSDHDRFFNQLFARGNVAPRDAADALDGRRGFVWLTDRQLSATVMHGMTAPTTASDVARSLDAEIAAVHSRDDLDAWHEVYCEVFGGDPRGRDEWRRIHQAVGPAGERSLLLLVARVDGVPAATGGVYFACGWAGLYWFTTRERMRGRGLASALVAAAHEAARERGIERALLHATPMGRPVYARAGYREVRSLPLLVAG
jgi:GNAT superfamily N-acetyltransferase